MTTGARVRIAFRRCVIRLKNTHTDAERGKMMEDKATDLVIKNNKHTDGWVTVVISRSERDGRGGGSPTWRWTDEFISLLTHLHHFRSRQTWRREIPKTSRSSRQANGESSYRKRKRMGKRRTSRGREKERKRKKFTHNQTKTFDNTFLLFGPNRSSRVIFLNLNKSVPSPLNFNACKRNEQIKRTVIIHS